MVNLLEFEEHVGMLWHRIASHGQDSYRDHRDAVVRFADMRPVLPVIFRALGGNPAAEFAKIDKRVSAHRLRLRQRIGLVDEQISLAELSESAVKLPSELSLFAHQSLNRDLYIWLMAWFAAARLDRPKGIDDPYRRDVWRLYKARETDLRVQRLFPGITALRHRLYQAFMALRPVRKLPMAEQRVEECVLAILHGADDCGDNPVWQQMDDGGTPIGDFSPLATPPGYVSFRYAPFLPVPLWGEVLACGTSAKNGADDPDEDGTSKDGDSDHKKRSRRRKNDQAGRNDPLAVNRFEKILSIAEMVNVNRPMDDEDEQDARRAASELEEMEISNCQRKAATRLRFDLDLPPADASGPALCGEFLYPEWDFRRQTYRKDFCKVITGVGDTGTSDPDARILTDRERRQIRHVRRQFEAFRPKHEMLRGQSDGSELDLEALVRARCDLAGNGAQNDRVYLRTVNRARDLAVAVLVDVSLSTDAWIDNHRVLDVEKQALQVLAGGLDACGDDFGVFSFTSRRRDWVRVTTLKDFDEPYSHICQDRIGALKPGYYTRLGAAIRHTGKLLAARPQQHRLMLVITDGKPNDIDHYEGRYGIEDSRRAVQECRRQGLGLFGVTIDRKAQDYFPYIFGAGGHAIVGHLEKLPAALPRIYRQLVR
ncbi:nitric oxide reductase activation protein NorD [Thalassospira sp.]|uniref:nitric oxide reductase activation protein NorD n=1 Tax=Thalassospira sp. TaxID=1912094 RepID=UPI0027324368|nr:VWA domain-containing protein [Thalassospira sp.]MDP2698444.1 VWA domain-containing protein [Thalassospira sp.]